MNQTARVYLGTFLAPLLPYLSRDDVTDLYVNRPGELWIETGNGTERIDLPQLDEASLWRLARQIAATSDQGITANIRCSQQPCPMVRASRFARLQQREVHSLSPSASIMSLTSG